MDTSTLTINSERLILQGISRDFAEDIFSEFTPEITTYMLPHAPLDIAETLGFINSSIDENREGKTFQAVILDTQSLEFLGCAGLHHIDGRTPAFGIWIKKSAHGHGYGKEAVTALKNWADQNLDYDYLLYPVDRRNLASRKIPEALGGTVAREYEEINQSGEKLFLVEYWINRFRQ